MSSHLPEFIDPWHFAEIGKEVSGCVPVDRLTRVAELLVDKSGDAEFELRFHKGERQRIHITGYARAELKLECQRCLEPVGIPVASEIDVVVVEGFDEAQMLDDEYEPLLAGDKRIRLYEVVEDELLLALPQVAMHEEGSCKMAAQEFIGSVEDLEEGEEKDNPFAVLADLKDRQN